MNPDDARKMRVFVQEIVYHPRAIDAQPHKREGDKMWCEDWEIIEICKYLFNGRENYYADPPPNRLKNNSLWSKDVIAREAERLLSVYGTADGIIESLSGRRTA